ncbi:MAG: M20/M25/M40 family metallo-hydrolase [Pseudomonadales bacterium]|jgi:acetylornithine deacetylase/succinyl-diaminopimelate desuccinylase-like protein|nr:M20/M25/M40 family metallo-hydrolase [Pseudomonadales bacterium]
MLRKICLSCLLLCVLPNSNAQQASSLEVAESIKAYRSDNEKQILQDFVELLSLPNDSINLADMAVNAEHIENLLQQRGFETLRLEAGRAPYVFGELLSPGATETLLLYAHFDGQPTQIENWVYPPFTPTLLDAPLSSGGTPIDMNGVSGRFDPEWRLYARSAGDDKMPVIALIHVLDAMRQNGIPLSVNLKVLFDGEEERGSPSLGAIIDANPGLFEADLMLFSDGPMHQSRRAQLVFGVRGGRTLDMTTYGAVRPLHSGHYGNWAPNPIMRMAYLLTSMRDESGRILIDGYYDNVATLSEREREAIDTMPNIEAMLQDELMVNMPEGAGMRIEELVTLPAFNARGFIAGGVGNQGRNIILSTATASINLRLVPNQDPERIREIIEAHVSAEGFYIVHEDPTPEQLREHEKVIKMDWRGGGSPGLRTSMDGEMAQRLIAVMREITPDLLLTPTMGGGLPLNSFDDRIDMPIVILPLANHDNNQHSENENLRLQNFWDAMTAYGVVLSQLGRP